MRRPGTTGGRARAPRRAAATACLLSLAVGTASGASPRTTWEGVYTASQADRGQALLDAHCAQCHASNLGGTQAAPAIAGLEMLYVWDGRTLAELMDYLRASMPPGQVGLVTDAEYTDIIAALLRASGFPEGKSGELTASAAELRQTVIRRLPPDGKS